MSMDADYSLGQPPPSAPARRHRAIVVLDDEQLAAVEGWRMAHGIADQAEALGELVRLALLGEIAKIYRLVSDRRSEDRRDPSDAHDD